MSKYIRVIGNYLKISFKKLFKKVNFSGSKVQSFSKFTELNLAKNSNVCFGRNIQSDGFCRIITNSDAKLSIGSKTYFNNGCTVSCMKKVTIGDNCLFGPNVLVCDNNHKFTAKEGVSFQHNTDEISIGNNCWIASNAVILKGVTIGNNCVIGAGCIIKENVADGSIVTAHIEQHINKIEDK
jgi:acetyltransferase-like isoleucine patch superfamily enzyme